MATDKETNQKSENKKAESKKPQSGKSEKKKSADRKTDGMSASKAKRVQQEQERKKKKRKARTGRVIFIVIVLVIAALIAVYVGKKIYYSVNKTEPSSDYSAQLNEDGTIKDITVTDYVTPCSVDDIPINLSDVQFTDEEVETNIQQLLENYKTLDSDTSLTVEDGDEVNIDYEGKIDGESFDGGSSDGNGYDLTIGSGTFVDDFEDQLIGTHPGDEVTVEVTFPDDYSDTDLAGKDAQFDVTVNGIYGDTEFNDEFVQEYLSDYATTADGYRQYLKETNYENNLKSQLRTYVSDNSTMKSYPKEYLKYLKGLERYTDEQSYEYMQQLYASYGYANQYSSFEDYIGMSTEEYEKDLTRRAKEQARSDFAFQALYEDMGLSISDEEYNQYLTDNSITDDDVNTYGKGYIMKNIMADKVLEGLEASVRIVDDTDSSGASTGSTSVSADTAADEASAAAGTTASASADTASAAGTTGQKH